MAIGCWPLPPPGGVSKLGLPPVAALGPILLLPVDEPDVGRPSRSNSGGLPVVRLAEVPPVAPPEEPAAPPGMPTLVLGILVPCKLLGRLGASQHPVIVPARITPIPATSFPARNRSNNRIDIPFPDLGNRMHGNIVLPARLTCRSFTKRRDINVGEIMCQEEEPESIRTVPSPGCRHRRF